MPTFHVLITTVLAVLLIAPSPARADTSPSVVKVGVLKNDGFEACCPDIGLIWDDAVDVAISAVNKDPNLLAGVKIEKVKRNTQQINETGASQAVGLEATIEMVLKEHVAAIFGAMYSSVSMPTSVVSGVYSVPQISAISGAPILTQGGHPTFMRTLEGYGSNEYGKVILTLLNHLGWREVSYVNDLEENGAGFADSSITALQDFLEPYGIETLTRAKFPYFDGLITPAGTFDAVLDTLRGSSSRIHIVSSQNALFTAFLFAMRDDGSFNMDEHYFIFLNDFKTLDPANYDPSELPFYYTDPPHEDYLTLSKNVFLLGFSSFDPGGPEATRYRNLTEELFLRPYQNQSCAPYQPLGNEIPLWEAFDTIFQGMDKLHKQGELLISVDSGDPTFMALYKARNAKLHEAMLGGNFTSVTGKKIDFYGSGDKKSPVRIYMIESGNALPENSLEWTPCESRSPYKGLDIVELTSSCVGEVNFEGCANWVTPATSIPWKNGQTAIPPATITTSIILNSKLSPEFIPAIVAFVVICFLVVINLKRKVNKTRNQVEELKLNLKLLREYNANEKKLIEAQIVEFKREFAEGKSSSTNSDLNKVLINAKELESEEVIGKGAFGEVYRGKYHGQAVAVKTLISVDHDSLTRFREEILLMADLHHANIVVLIGACWEESLMALVMEFCEKGMSSSVLKREGSSFSWEDPLLKWSLDVTRAMQYLHSVVYYNVKTKEEVHGILHRDLKPDNCLVTDTFAIKVADFGEARAIDLDNTMTQVGTPIYIAPEIVRGDHYATSCDVYSFAVTVLQFGLRGSTPLLNFLHNTMMDEKKKSKNITMSVGRITHSMIAKDWRPSGKAIEAENIPKCIVGLLQLCWHADPSERPSFSEIEHFLKVDAMQSIQGVVGTGNIRRTSTSGSLALRIAKHKHEAKGKSTKEDQDSVEVLKRRVQELEEENKELKGESRPASPV
ncbi:hypothetical protein TrVE_jg6880 [Triparma verrucosa]|uniref:Protein kinase domain-containing protein n=1 Tax=Triparma verrucosa TaxID=1606542 RepID=A0A9W7BAM4_9STRA|nr:hypothetical protein TrVE_jg6880 [Triparma verrucosa]